MIHDAQGDEHEVRPFETKPARDVGIDVARGLALFGIALANVTWHVWGVERGVAYYPDPAASENPDRVAAAIVVGVLQATMLPVFALLFGWGVTASLRALRCAGVSDVAARRHSHGRFVALAALGLLHGILLFDGDILVILAVTGWVVLFACTLSDRALMCFAAAGVFVRAGILGLAEALALVDAPDDITAAAAHPDFLGSIYERAQIFGVELVGIPIHVLTTVPLALIGVWWARSGRLDPDAVSGWNARRLAWAMSLAIVAGVPISGAVGGFWAYDPLGLGLAAACQALAAPVAATSGVLLVLAAVRHGALPPFVVAALSAAGARSLSLYLLQSLLFATLMSAWGVGLGWRLGMLQSLAVAVAVWVASVVVALAWQRRGFMGPAELCVRAWAGRGLRAG